MAIIHEPAALSNHLIEKPTSIHGWDELAELGYGLTCRTKPVNEHANRIAGILARQLVETLTGRRDPKQLKHWLTFEERQALNSWICKNRETTIKLTKIRLAQSYQNQVHGAIYLSYGDRLLCASISLRHDGFRWICLHLNILLPGNIGSL